MSNWPGPPVTPAMVGTFKAWAGVSLGRSQSQPCGLRHPGAPTSTAACKLVWRGGAGRGASPLSGRPCPHTCISGPSKSGKPPQGENVQSSPPPGPPPRPAASFVTAPRPPVPQLPRGTLGWGGAAHQPSRSHLLHPSLHPAARGLKTNQHTPPPDISGNLFQMCKCTAQWYSRHHHHVQDPLHCTELKPCPHTPPPSPCSL